MKKFVVLLLISSVFGASSVDTAIYAPTLVNAIPDLSISPGQSVTLDFKYNINCSSTVTPTTNNPVWSVTPTVVGNGTLALSSVGVLTGIPASSVAGYVVKCVNNTSPVVGASDTFNLTISGSGPVVATGYFIDCVSGNNANLGTTYSAPWLTLSKATSLATGSDVWLKSGTTCNDQQLIVNWAGTSGNRVTIGSYYVNAGVAYQGYVGFTRPAINGTYEPSCRAWPSKCAWNTTSSGLDHTGTGAIPASHFAALVSVNAQKYVTVQDFEMRDSAGIGILFDGVVAGDICTAALGTSCEFYWEARNNKVSHTAQAGLRFIEGRYFVAYGNEIEYAALEWPDSQPKTDGTAVTNWPAALGSTRCQPCYGLYENNTVHDVWGEGIGPFHNSVVLVRGNHLANVRRPYMYTSGGRFVVEQNILAGGVVDHQNLGDPNRRTQNGPGYASLSFHREASGTAGGDYNTEETTKQLYRNNLVANYQACLHTGINAGEVGFSLGGKHVGNTCVGTDGTGNGAIWDNGSAALTAPEGIEQANNILAVTSGTAVGTCVNDALAIKHHNYWTGTPTDADCREPVPTNDIYGTYAGLGLGVHAFDTADITNFPVYTWFQIPLTSTAATGGTALTTTYLTEADWTWILSQRTWLSECQSAQVSSAEFVKVLSTDYCGVARTFGSIGAFNRSP